MFGFLSSYWSGTPEPAKPDILETLEGTLFKGTKCFFQHGKLILQTLNSQASLKIIRQDEFLEDDDIREIESPTNSIQNFRASLTHFDFQIDGTAYKFEFDSKQEGAQFVAVFGKHCPVQQAIAPATPAKQEPAGTPVKSVSVAPSVTPVKQTIVVKQETPAVTPVKAVTPIKQETPKKHTPIKEQLSKITTPTFSSARKPSGTPLHESLGIFCAHSPDGKNQLVIGDTIQLSLIQASKFEYTVAICNQDELFCHWNLSQDVNLEWKDANCSIQWIAEHAGTTHLFSFAFSGLSQYSTFKAAYCKALLEAKRREVIKVDLDDASWIEGGLCTMFKSVRIEDESEEDEMDYDDMPQFTKKPAAPSTPSGSSNSLLSVGRCKKDRSYVVRGDQLGTFSPSKGKMNYLGSSKIASAAGKVPFSPSHAMLHSKDEKMLLLHPTEKKKIFCMDLERGQVIEEWETDGMATSKILPETKDAQIQGRDTFLGINNAGFFVMDSRQKDKVVRNFQYKNAATTHFACAATTEDGHLAVGTKLGETRLFNASSLAKGSKNYIESTAPRAKTKLLGYGDAIIGMDVTRDGKFVLSTCATYLLLTRVADDNKSGFETSFKKHPYRLCLQPVDVMRVGGKVHFTPAKFNIVGTETYIVSSTANWLITWDFTTLMNDEDLPANTVVPYSMKRLPDTVVADDFSAETKGDVVLSLPEDVYIHSTRNLFQSPR